MKNDKTSVLYRKANENDLKNICRFTDFWLSGRGKAKGVPLTVNDYFISPSQHRKYIIKYTVLLATFDYAIVGWAVLQLNNTLTHLLVAGSHRAQGIGKHMLRLLCPETIHSKSDQSTGNPLQFYKHLGYEYVKSVQSKGRFDIDKIRPDRPKNIDVLQRIDC